MSIETLERAGTLGRLLVRVRQELDTAVTCGGREFERQRSQVAFGRVMARVAERHRRGRWWRVGVMRGVTRTIRAMTAIGSSLWNCRALRMLMP
jgi:hypothetical protein